MSIDGFYVRSYEVNAAPPAKAPAAPSRSLKRLSGGACAKVIALHPELKTVPLDQTLEKGE